VLFKWFRDTFARQDRQQALAEGSDIYSILASEMPEGPGRVIVLPHFTATGPPQFIANSCGVMAGLHLDTSRGEILKGILEGTTFYLRECIESLPAEIAVKNFRAAGGGSKSESWLQLCADILGRSFEQPEINEAGALGAAILAGNGSGVFASIAEGVDRMVKIKRRFDPQMSASRVYDGQFVKYKKLWPLMKDYLPSLAAG
jgi:xylulokinase